MAMGLCGAGQLARREWIVIGRRRGREEAHATVIVTYDASPVRSADGEGVPELPVDLGRPRCGAWLRRSTRRRNRSLHSVGPPIREPGLPSAARPTRPKTLRLTPVGHPCPQLSGVAWALAWAFARTSGHCWLATFLTNWSASSWDIPTT
jgi:hypothetical protein